jgi:putative ABC transport system permease protein
VVASFALASAMAIMVHSFRDSVDRWLDTVLPADLYARSAGGAAFAALTPALQQRLEALPGVSRVQFLRGIEVTLDPARPGVVVLARPLDPARVQQQLPVTGEVLAPPAGSVPIYVSEAMVDLYGFAPGREVTLPLGTAPARFFVAGVWRDYARQHGAVMLPQEHYRRLTGDDSVSDAGLWLAPGTDPQQLLDRIRAELPELDALEWRSAAEVRELSLRIFDRSFAVTYVLEAIAIVVGLFGVAATYAGEALARAREFGMLRHLGVTRAQIGRLFAIESGVLIVTGVAWGGAIGALIAWVLVHRVNPQSFHWTMDIAWPWPLLGASAGALVLLGVGAAVIASRSATGGSPVRAVREDW